MKTLVKIAAAALATSVAFVAPVQAKSDNEDYNAAKSLCRAEIAKAAGLTDKDLRDGSFQLKMSAVRVQVRAPLGGKSQAVGCSMDRKTQALTLKWPEGYTPTVAAAAPAETAAPTAEATAAPVAQ